MGPRWGAPPAWKRGAWAEGPGTLHKRGRPPPPRSGPGRTGGRRAWSTPALSGPRPDRAAARRERWPATAGPRRASTAPGPETTVAGLLPANVPRLRRVRCHRSNGGGGDPDERQIEEKPSDVVAGPPSGPSGRGWWGVRDDHLSFAKHAWARGGHGVDSPGDPLHRTSTTDGGIGGRSRAPVFKRGVRPPPDPSRDHLRSRARHGSTLQVTPYHGDVMPAGRP